MKHRFKDSRFVKLFQRSLKKGKDLTAGELFTLFLLLLLVVTSAPVTAAQKKKEAKAEKKRLKAVSKANKKNS